MYGLTVITAPEVEPISLTEAKAQLRVEHTDEDDLLDSLIVAARELSEAYTGRRWITQELRLTLEGWPCVNVSGFPGAIRLPVDPVASIDAINYYAADGTLTALDSADWQTWLEHSPPLVAPAPLTAWPTLQAGRMAPVQVEFTAGYGDAASDVPDRAKHAMKLCVAYWYEHRGDGNDPHAIQGLPATLGLPPAAKRLLDLLWSGQGG